MKRSRHRGLPRRRCLSGLTLLELLVAMSLFAVVATLSHGGLQAVLRNREATEASVRSLSELRRAWVLLEADFSQALPRIAHDTTGQPRPSFILASDRVELSRGVDDGRVAVRVEYRLQGEDLMRYEWPAVDLAPDSVPRSGLVLAKLEAFGLRVYSNGGAVTAWPLAELATPLPQAIEVRVKQAGREYRWLLPVNG